jgi:hypothetical protein
METMPEITKASSLNYNGDGRKLAVAWFHINYKANQKSFSPALRTLPSRTVLTLSCLPIWRMS